MNAISVALLWCVVQVTLVAVAAGGVYLAVRRWRPDAATPAVPSGLATVVLLSLWALSPWPRWSLSVSPPVESTAAALPAGESAGTPVPAESLAGPDVGRWDDTDDRDTAFLGSAQPGKALADHRVQAEPVVPTRPTPAISPAWPWPTIVAAAMLAAMLCGLGRLVLGIVAVRRERTRSRLVRDRKLLELVDALREELGCRRPVEVRQSDALATAATIGWRRPVLLLPGDWTRWTPDQRRAVLAHEIVHARSHDFLALLVGQIGLTLHFYHPLVHWLLGRLRLEQELAADAAAAAVSGGPRQYLATIAELALGQQDRRVLWPARTFLPTPTTFLRRIAMLQNSKTRVERLSPTARLATVAAVLLCGLLAAGLRGPSDSRAALAGEKEKPASNSTVDAAVGADAANAAADCIDTTYMMESASAMIVLRPAALLRPELAALVKRFEESGCVVPKGSRLADFRQITAFVPEAEISSGPREVVVWQWIKPMAEAELAKRDVGKELRVEDRNGKKVYHFPSARLAVLCDDRTVVEGSAPAVGAYLSGKVGTLPRWLPEGAWKSLARDQFVMAADASRVRQEMRPLLEHAPAIPQAATLAISPVWENATWLAAGARLDDRLTIHAEATATDAESAQVLQQTVEAIKMLAQAALETTRAGIEKWLSQPMLPMLGNAQVADSGRRPNRESEFVVFDVVGRLLEDSKVRREGLDVRLETSIALDAARLGSLASELAAMIGAARGTAAPSTKEGAVALVEDFFRHNFRDVTSRETIEWADYKKTSEGNFSIRYKYRARIWDRETKLINQVFTFDPEGKFVSVKDVLEPPSTKEGMVALVEDFFRHNFRDVTSRETIEWADFTKTPEGNYSIRYTYRARIWDRQTKILNQVFTFDPEGKFVSVKDVAESSPTDAEKPAQGAATNAKDAGTMVPKL